MIVDIDGIETMKAIQDPQVGDRFHDMYSWWVYIVHRDESGVVTLEGLDFPNNAKARVMSHAQFKDRFLGSTGRPWVRLASRGDDVRGWDRVALGKLVRV